MNATGTNQVTPELAIIVVNWNGGELLKRCLNSVRTFPPGASFELLVVDNSSTDGSREWLETQTDVRLIKNAENVGFAKANNQAFKLSNARLFFLLNSDAEIHAQTLDTLIATIRSAKEIGVVGPRLLNPDGSLQPSVWPNPTTPFETLTNAFRLYKLMPKRVRAERLLGYHWDHSEQRKANLLSGAALLIKREVIDDVKGFDERFHLYGEDTEWCLRVVRGAWTILFEPAATVTHYGGASAAKRWTNLEKRRAEYLAFFQFQRLALSRRLVLGNLLSGIFIVSTQWFWRLLTLQSRDEPSMVAKLYRDELMAVFSGKNPGKHEPSPSRVRR